ncbi:MAG: hypothetical protein ACE5HC_10925 [Candidatus Binatia bacterium]
MNNALKGAFWSGFIFPGLGQIVLKHHKRGAFIMLVVLVSISVVVVEAARSALAILEAIAASGGAINMNTILSAATQAVVTSRSFTLNLVLWTTILCWIIGVVDAYRIGRKKDIEEASTGQLSNGKGD